jgi:hypothetical protein
MTAARVVVARKSDEDARDRQVVVSIDGKPLATLMFGQTAARELEPGPHRLRAHNTLVWKTVDFELQPGETAQFSVINRPGRGTFGLLSLLGARPLYLDVRRDPEQ